MRTTFAFERWPLCSCPERFSSPLLVSIALFASGCGGGSGSSGGGGTPPSTPSTANEWTWMSGSSTVRLMANGFYSQPGIYGTLGVASSSNVPGGRAGAISWTDSSGNLWLFGGNGYDSAGTLGILNDLWEFSPTAKTWTWVSGGNTGAGETVASRVSTAQDACSEQTFRSERDAPVSWTDTSGDLWLFGGAGFDSTGAAWNLNDLWEFSPTTKIWTWMGGSNTGSTSEAVGVYGTEGVAASSNVPGARYAVEVGRQQRQFMALQRK